VENPRRRKINLGPGLGEVDAIPLTFRAAGENWNEYLVEDGTVIRLKLVATEVYRLIDRYDQDGNPQYIIRSGNVMVVSPPEDLRRKP